MATETSSLARRWFEEVWVQRRAETIDELVDADSVCHGDDGPVQGPDGFKQQFYEPMVAAFPDLQVQVEAVIAEGDQAVVRWSAVGTHSGDGLGFPATGEAASFRGLTWMQVRDGRLGVGWQSSNIPEVLRTLAEKANP
ncbi:ester cyclase [Alienimonas californiensis]|uniref:SnoaL-like polyketide cyclase n=1 Tax=Alienimonas californiensis TaxID=2527989 RepID=A0A517PEY3_9PLAN|nr:ester cyclase [Alienimonas californiensis]QDT17939.1 SnoaL-like polyketide cyclase [Alienimonas californiensis]